MKDNGRPLSRIINFIRDIQEWEFIIIRIRTLSLPLSHRNVSPHCPNCPRVNSSRDAYCPKIKRSPPPIALRCRLSGFFPTYISPKPSILPSSAPPNSFPFSIHFSQPLNPMEYEPSSPTSPASLKQKLRSSSCFSCCFRGAGGEGRVACAASEDERPLSLIRSSSVWLRSKAQELPEIRNRCRIVISRMGRQRRQSGDFRYDPLSYALNFDEGFDDDALPDEEFRFRNFSSRLPPSPPPPAAVEIAT